MMALASRISDRDAIDSSEPDHYLQWRLICRD